MGYGREEERDLLYIDDLVKFVESAITNQKEKYKLYNCGAGRKCFYSQTC